MTSDTTTGATPQQRDRRSADPIPAETTATATASRAFAWLLIVTGALGILASFVITIDKIQLIQDPHFTPSCNLSPVLSCSNVMRSAQASVFGFPNPLLGLATYPVVVTVGFALLAGARFRRWFWLGLNAGTLFGAGFCMWLMSQALYDIGALCLWCCLAWAATIAMFWYTTAHNLMHGVIRAPRAVVAGVLEFHWVVPLTWYLGIVMLIATRWWDYWGSLL
ncbi:membrane protein [Streptomyces hygroscopicus subsp. hygroscopicus]|uniref:vitamin K epoxide reductase family protein n=1 Tax=Streptomyces sp. KHY 26 TaxID=3097359 RepID=UPI0024A46C56|nr:vitamin K epoxide reductase family protein [Streptomyces hygroscopicus]GLX50105.1 membrane protein [Streptomyces hygroscopicus subsp. hygroscopicus]